MSYRLAFILNFFVMVLLMKLASWLRQQPARRPPLMRFLFLTPLLSASPRYHARLTPTWLLVIKFLLATSFLSFTVGLFHHFLGVDSYFHVILICPLIYFMTDALGALAQAIPAIFLKPIPPMHDHPLRARTLSEFWGRKWNMWVQDWLRDMSWDVRQNHGKKIMVSFLLSGLFHELMVNLPYMIYYQESTFGNMMLYFMVQGAGLWTERRFRHRIPSWLNRLYLWALVILPAPIFINRPLRIFLGVIDG